MSPPALRSARLWPEPFGLLGAGVILASVLGGGAWVAAQTRAMGQVVHRYCDELRRGGPGSPLSAGFGDHLAHAGPTEDEAGALALIRTSHSERFFETSGDSDTACYGVELEGSGKVWFGLRREEGAWRINQLSRATLGGCGDD